MNIDTYIELEEEEAQVYCPNLRISFWRVIAMTRRIVDLYAIIAMSILMLLAIIPNASAQAELFLFGGLFCAIWVVFFIVWLMVALWVYRDAESKGQSGALWLLLVLLTGLIGLIIYLIVRSGWPEHPPMAPQYGYQPMAYPCPTCGMPLTFVPQYNRYYCNHCQRYA
jgi:hypothetical protein